MVVKDNTVTLKWEAYSLTNMRLARKNLQVKNALAYSVSPSATEKQFSIKLRPVVAFVEWPQTFVQPVGKC